MLKKLAPNLMVEDVRHTLTFYQDILNFRIVMTLPEIAPFDFAIVQRDGVELMFQSRQTRASPKTCQRWQVARLAPRKLFISR
jgi:hypothetical protein